MPVPRKHINIKHSRFRFIAPQHPRYFSSSPPPCPSPSSSDNGVGVGPSSAGVVGATTMRGLLVSPVMIVSVGDGQRMLTLGAGVVGASWGSTAMAASASRRRRGRGGVGVVVAVVVDAGAGTGAGVVEPVQVGRGVGGKTDTESEGVGVGRPMDGQRKARMVEGVSDRWLSRKYLVFGVLALRCLVPACRGVYVSGWAVRRGSVEETSPRQAFRSGLFYIIPTARKPHSVRFEGAVMSLRQVRTDGRASHHIPLRHHLPVTRTARDSSHTHRSRNHSNRRQCPADSQSSRILPCGSRDSTSSCRGRERRRR